MIHSQFKKYTANFCAVVVILHRSSLWESETLLCTSIKFATCCVKGINCIFNSILGAWSSGCGGDGLTIGWLILVVFSKLIDSVIL